MTNSTKAGIYKILVLFMLVFTALPIYHFISYNTVENIGEWEQYCITFSDRAPNPVVVDFSVNAPTYEIAEGMENLGYSRDGFSTLLISLSGRDVNMLAFTDDARTYFVEERILSDLDAFKYIARISEVRAEKGAYYINLTFFYAKDWWIASLYSLICLGIGTCIIVISHKLLFRKGKENEETSVVTA